MPFTIKKTTKAKAKKTKHAKKSTNTKKMKNTKKITKQPTKKTPMKAMSNSHVLEQIKLLLTKIK